MPPAPKMGPDAVSATMLRRFLICCLATLALWAPAARAALPDLLGGGSGNVVTTAHVRAELLAEAPEGGVPGGTFWLGLRLDHQPGWHTYWRNAGDSGLPTHLAWTLPAGLAAGDVQWPTPRRLPVQGGLVNYGYEGTVLLPVPVRVAPGFRGTSLAVKLHADWLVCQVECVPEQGEFSLTLPAAASTLMAPELFAAARAAQPVDASGASATATVQAAPGLGRIEWRVRGLPATVRGTPVNFFPETPEVMANDGPVQARWVGDAWVAEVALSPLRETAPATLPAVLTFGAGDAAHGAPGLRVVAAVSGAWPLAPERAELPEALRAGLAADRAAAPAVAGSAWLALALAFVGGLLLNLMPCVFPVLAIKALAFAESGSRRARMASAAGYAAGVVATMLALAALLLALRAAGAGLGWGFQLQSPAFVALLAVLFTLVGLNLVGVYAFSAVLPQAWSDWRGRRPWSDALGAGVLSVLAATPCTAPLMGAALGTALALPAGWSLAIFLALAIGLALPLVLLACLPGWARRLPRPGAWMERLRTLLAFPMFATVVWLVWVAGQQVGVDGAAGLLALLLALAFAAWVLGGTRRRAGPGPWLARGTAVAVLAAASAWAVPLLRAPAAGGSGEVAEGGWQRWTPERAASLSRQQPVFVDFTAAWCVTCQVNKRTTLSRPEVQSAFARRGVALLQADWTRRDPAIAAELGRLGRSGLPVYLLLAPGRTPELLPEVLTPGIVERALESLPPAGEGA